MLIFNSQKAELKIKGVVMDNALDSTLNPGLSFFDLLPTHLLEHILMFRRSHEIVYFSTSVSKSLSVKCHNLNWRNFMIKDFYEFFVSKLSQADLTIRLKSSDQKTKQRLLSGKHGEFQAIFNYSQRNKSADVESNDGNYKTNENHKNNGNYADNPLFLNKKYRLRYITKTKQELRAYILTVDLPPAGKFDYYANQYSYFNNTNVSARYERDNALRVFQMMSNQDYTSIHIRGLPPLTMRYIYCLFSPDTHANYSNGTSRMNIRHYFLSKEALIKACIEEYYEYRKALAENIKRSMIENGTDKFEKDEFEKNLDDQPFLSKISRSELKEELFNALDTDSHNVGWSTDILEGEIRIPKRVLVLSI